MKVNIYDFDKTIYNGDSTVDFYLFCLRKNKSIIKYIIPFFLSLILYIFKKTSKEEMKEKLFAFLNDFDNIDILVKEFWAKNQKKIKKFYKEKDHRNDIIISASPEFLLSYIAKELKVKKLIASPVNKKTGKYEGNNCSGKEKVIRLNKYQNNLIINEVYSDSYKDTPILDLGNKSFLVKKEKIKKYQKQTIIVRLLKIMFFILFITSNPFMTMMFISEGESTYYPLTKILFVLSFIISIILYIVIINKQDINKKVVIISIIIGLYVVANVYNNSNLGIHLLINIIAKLNINKWRDSWTKELMAVISLPSICTYIYLAIIKLFPYIKREVKSLTKKEKEFLIISFTIGLIFTLTLYKCFDAFYYPKFCQNHVCVIGVYDVIYTTDTGFLNMDNTFYKIGSLQNDVRQPLFGLFSMPFSLTAKFISSFFTFIPNSYYIIFNAIQILLLSITLLMISRFFENNRNNKITYILLSMCSYSVIAFSFIQEQYIISLFYLILAIYVYYKYKPNLNHFYIGAVGALITSGIILPTITKEKIKNFKNYIINIIKEFLVFVCFIVLTGQVIVFLPKKFMYLKGFTGVSTDFIQKLKQYLFFIRSIFISPGHGRALLNKSGYMTYVLKEVNNYSILGIIILMLCIISFIKNKDKLIARISFFWIIFSFIILCLVGWGTKENGLILYSLYFFWAFIVLISMLINNIKNIRIKRIILSIIIIIMLVSNIDTFLDLLEFCFKYYAI